MEENKCDQLKLITAPLVEFLKENYNPHCRIIIDFDGVRVVEDVVGVPYEEKAHSTEE